MLGALVAFAGCTRVNDDAPGAAAARHAWTVPDTLRVTSGLVPRTLNPLLATQTIEASLNRLVFDILVTCDSKGDLVPDLASEVPTTANGGISRDGLTITYHLRRGVKWHDGVPFTSKDVAFSFAAIMNPKTDVISRHGYDDVARVETPDDFTVVFHLKRRFAPFVATVFGDSDSPYAVVPAHLLARYASLDETPFNAAPVGTGPFKVVRWQRGDRIEYVRNDDYFRGRPKLARIVWRFVADENTEITLLRTHEADWMFEASLVAYKTMKTIPEIVVTLPAVNGYGAIMMNAGRGPTKDVRLRRAIVMAIDKPALVRELTAGAGEVATGDLPPFLWAFDPSVRNLPYDPAAARRELVALGYGPAKPLVLDLVYEQSQVVERALVVQVQQALHDVGITLTTRPQLSSVIYGGWAGGGTLSHGKYDLAAYIWIAGIDPDNSAQFLCANRPPHGYDQSYYCSPTMDAAQARAIASYDQATRKSAYATIERSVVADAPLDIIYWLRNVQGISPDLHGFDPNPVVETWDVANWSI